MNETTKRDGSRPDPVTPRSGAQSASRLALLLAGGVLLSVLVSCACGPVR